jgi:hypothetical protein
MLALVALAATLAAAADASPSKKFVSKRYGCSIVLPAASTSSPASRPWNGGPPFMDLSGVDSYEVADGRTFAVAARALPRTTTLQKWASLYVGTAVPGFCTKSRGYRATTLGGARALAFTGHCEHRIDHSSWSRLRIGI